jgi:hypothetical protein
MAPGRRMRARRFDPLRLRVLRGRSTGRPARRAERLRPTRSPRFIALPPKQPRGLVRCCSGTAAAGASSRDCRSRSIRATTSLIVGLGRSGSRGCPAADGSCSERKLAMKSRHSSLATAETRFHSDAVSRALARTGAATAIRSAAKTATRSTGIACAATARAAAVRTRSSTRRESLRIWEIARSTRSPSASARARATSSTSCLQRTARSCGSDAGWASTVLNRSSNRTSRNSRLLTRNLPALSAGGRGGSYQRLTIPKRDSGMGI